MKKTVALLLVLLVGLASLMLTACGGGGSDGNPLSWMQGRWSGVWSDSNYDTGYFDAEVTAQGNVSGSAYGDEFVNSGSISGRFTDAVTNLTFFFKENEQAYAYKVVMVGEPLHDYSAGMGTTVTGKYYKDNKLVYTKTLGIYLERSRSGNLKVQVKELVPKDAENKPLLLLKR